jgi:Fe-S-cluster containining protein
MVQLNPCMRCGACCAAYRISFDCHETDNHIGGVVPLDMTFRVNDTRSAMKGTGSRPFRCGALGGDIGRAVYCKIYDNRPSTCHEFICIWEGTGDNSLCDQARARYGLAALSNF